MKRQIEFFKVEYGWRIKKLEDECFAELCEPTFSRFFDIPKKIDKIWISFRKTPHKDFTKTVLTKQYITEFNGQAKRAYILGEVVNFCFGGISEEPRTFYVKVEYGD